MLKALGHSGLDRLLLELELPVETAGRGSSLLARANSLAEFAIRNPGCMSPRRRTIAYEIVGRATEIWRNGCINNLLSEERDKFAMVMREGGQGELLEPTQSRTSSDWRSEDVVPIETRPLAQELQSFWPTTSLPEIPNPTTLKKVFIVHGHDEAALHGVARFLERLGLQAIVLREQPDQGRTIIEKFEACAAEVGFAVVLFTPDDLGAILAGPQQAPRARQNVIFELGYFVGKLGRGRACLLLKGEIEVPSDLSGVIYIELDAGEGWKGKLARELVAAKFEFDGKKVWE